MEMPEGPRGTLDVFTAASLIPSTVWGVQQVIHETTSLLNALRSVKYRQNRTSIPSKCSPLYLISHSSLSVEEILQLLIFRK